MSGTIYFLLIIFNYIFLDGIYINGQFVQSKPPQSACVPQSVTLTCMNNYVVVVKSAFYGVAQTPGSCTYTPGDCIADAMSIVTCSTDTISCSFYATRRRLPQCNEEYSSYVQIEYDCVPLSMDDSTKDYNVCQNGTEITTDHGILRSPGYPSQFQTTTTECFRAIHVANDKIIRLWLSDLYIGSTSTNCADDHVIIVDSIQTYKHCGLKRYAYPYLCSSTIIIQYFVKTELSIYKGMRMYFEIVDRPANDNCPGQNGTVTLAPATTPTITPIDPDATTTIPSYVTLGVASPVISFQLCKGESYTIECPNNYVVVVIKNIFGVTQSDQCEPYDAAKHCVITTQPTFMCIQKCTYLYLGNRPVTSCNNKIATYQYVEYQCIPKNVELISPNTPCPTNGSKTSLTINRRGRFQNYNYPNLQAMDCTYHLKTTLGHIMHIYSLEISLNDYSTDCQANKVSFIEDDDNGQVTDFCEERAYSLIYLSCSNELDLRYVVKDASKLISSGAELYIETQLRPLDLPCGKPISPATTPTTPLTTAITFPTATPITSDGIMSALAEVEYDICFGSALTYTCPTGYTFMILKAFYGVKKQASNKCGFVQGDCVQEALSTITQCRNDVTACYLPYGTRRKLAHCSDKYADYLHVTYQCVPSRPVGIGSTLQTYDICHSTDSISNFNGIITSPGFPSYKQTTNECKRTIIGVLDKVLKIWINEMAVSSGSRRSLTDESDKPDVIIHKKHETDNIDDLEQMYPSIRDVCVKDYLIVDTPHVAHVYCGTRKLALEPICATSVTIQYKTTSQPNIFYKGFKFYFEWVEKPADIFCVGSGSTLDPLASTTPDNTPIPIWAENLELSPILHLHVCLGTMTMLRCPRSNDYALAIINTDYAVTGTGSCEVPSPFHCHQEASLDLSCTPSCLIEYEIPKPLVQCGMQNADYLNIDYECIPTRLPNNDNPIDICSSTTTDTIAMNAGMIVSPQYPTLSGIRSCSKRIETLKSKLWMVFIVDLFLEGDDDFGNCNAASLIINDGNDKVIRCGLHRPELVLISCTNIVEFNFKATHQALGYRGFKVYFKTIDAPDGWGCVSSFTNTTTARPTTTLATIPPSSFIVASGGTTNGTRQYCKFPFTYQNNEHINCLRIPPPIPSLNNEPWCSLTSNFDTDGQWGFCNISVTDATFYDVCRNQSQQLKCPLGYVINIITASHAAKQDGNIGQGSCHYNQNDCFQSYGSTIQTICAGKPSCTITHIPKTLASCYSRPSAYLHINYACIPNDIQEMHTYNLCDNASLPGNDVRRGFINSPNYPNTPNNIDCTFNLQTFKPHQDIFLYIIDIDLNSPDLLGENCVKDRFIVGAENGEREMCGRLYTDRLFRTCHSPVSFRLIRTFDVTGRGVKLYFEIRDRPDNQHCVPFITTTTSAPTPIPTSTVIESSTQTTTTIVSRPNYFPDPSPRMLQALCYPDISASFGANNFQCPKNYIIVIHRAFYGIGHSCDYTPGDCTSEAEGVSRTCSGKQACSVPFTNIYLLPECNKLPASYLFVEYQCLPTPQITPNVDELCFAQINQAPGISGILKSPSYPTYTQTQCENVTLSSIEGSNLVIYLYLLDRNIGSPDLNTGECKDDYLLLSYQCNNQLFTERICGTHNTEILLATCAPTDKIFASYNLLSEDSQSQRGFALLYYFLPRFVDPVTTTTTRLTTTTKLTTSTTTLSPGKGPVSEPVKPTTSCVQEAIVLRCNSAYALVLYKIQLSVGATSSCTYSPNDCFEDRMNLYSHCAGLASCNIFPPKLPIKACNGSTSSYLYTEHQCIPKRPKLNLDVCSVQAGFSVGVEGGAMISSLNYAPERKDCTVKLQSNPGFGSAIHKAFRVYILTLNLPLRALAREQGAQCSDNDPYIEINDPQLGVTRLCGNSHTRYVLETCSDTIDIQYRNFNTGTITKYKGFEIYFESITNEKCSVTPPPSPPSPPLVINDKIACALSNGNERVSFSCTPNHGLVFLQSYQFITREPAKCDLSEHICHYPSEQPQAQCSGQTQCSYAHPDLIGPPSNPCGNTRPDSIQFYYQCLPMRLSTEYSIFKFCSTAAVTSTSGFIETPGFPASYQQGRQQCSLSIPLPDNNDGKKYSVYLYILDLSIRDSTIINPSFEKECIDLIMYTDGNTTKSLCGNIDQPVLEYRTNKTELNLTLIMLQQALPSNEMDKWRGARLFFIVGDQSLPPPPSSLLSTVAPSSTTKRPGGDESTRSPKKPNHGGVIAGVIIGVLLALLAVVGFILYRRRLSRLQSSETHKVAYNTGMDAIDSTVTNGATEKRSSIPAASLKGPSSSTFISPFYKKTDTTATQETDNTTEA